MAVAISYIVFTTLFSPQHVWSRAHDAWHVACECEV